MSSFADELKALCNPVEEKEEELYHPPTLDEEALELIKAECRRVAKEGFGCLEIILEDDWDYDCLRSPSDYYSARGVISTLQNEEDLSIEVNHAGDYFVKIIWDKWLKTYPELYSVRVTPPEDILYYLNQLIERTEERNNDW
jgi:hypothetical protein